MYCSTCGAAVTAKLNYCNRCGARMDKTTVVNDSSGVKYLATVTGIVGLGGLGILFALILLFLERAVESRIILFVTIFYLAASVGIIYLLIQQLNKLINVNVERKVEDNPAKNPDELPAATTAQLNEHREPARSVTEHTTKTLDGISIK